MQKVIMITGSTDGIGLETAKQLVSMGHQVLIHGRNPAKLREAEQTLSTFPGSGRVDGYTADLSRLDDVIALARSVSEKYENLDVLINNAGVYNTPDPITPEGLDVRFVVNTIAPYLLTQKLMPLLGTSGRVVNLASAAQASVETRAITGEVRLSSGEAYAQSKLALIMWSRLMADAKKDQGPAIIPVNPGSLLGSKMVKQAFGVTGGDIRIGADILIRASLDQEFVTASGKYFDNDRGSFAQPHPDALDPGKSQAVISAIEAILSD